jgi:hypothetical protein
MCPGFENLHLLIFGLGRILLRSHPHALAIVHSLGFELVSCGQMQFTLELTDHLFRHTNLWRKTM